MIKQNALYAGIAMLFSLLTACTKKQAEEFTPSGPGAPGTEVSYAATIAPILQAKCAVCHAAGRSGTVSWTFNGFSTVVANADRIKNAVLVTKSMPLNGSLSPAELLSIKDWFDQGMKP